MGQTAIIYTLPEIEMEVEPGDMDDELGVMCVYNGTSWQQLRGRDLALCLQTFSGRFFWPLEPHEDEVHVEDIAHGLACEYRYGNHSPYPYSVAWHSVVLSQVVPDHLKKVALMHDAPEAYIKDIPRPIRSQEPFKTEYEKIDKKLQKVIFSAMELDESLLKELLDYDIRMSHTEMLVWAEDNPVFSAKLKALNVNVESANIKEWMDLVRRCPRHDHWKKAKTIWLRRYRELFENANS